jgi:hypothetical protein
MHTQELSVSLNRCPDRNNGREEITSPLPKFLVLLNQIEASAFETGQDVDGLYFRAQLNNGLERQPLAGHDCHGRQFVVA